jgi:chemotaxis-related protein WspB
MLMLLFNIDDERYALDSQQVVEIIPLVFLKTLPHTPEYIAGVFNYRGEIVPVIDLCQIIHERASRQNLSTRIILVQYWGSKNTEAHPPHLIGLMVEKVVQTVQKSQAELIDTNLQINAAPYLGKMIVDDQGMIQCINLENLFSDTQRVDLLPESHQHTGF